jgi:hypothetical protein
MTNQWFRFPIDVIDSDTNKQYELLEQNIPLDEYYESWVDIRLDSIVQIRPFVAKDNELNNVTGTILYTTSGESHVVNVLPKTVREILGYEINKLPSIKQA